MPVARSEVDAAAQWRGPLWVAGALAALGAVLAFAAARHGTVALLYEESGNGCRTLTAGSAADLARALVPVRVLVAAWVLATALPAVASVVRAEPVRRVPVAIGGAVVAVVLAGANQAFIGTDLLSALLPLALLWLGAGVLTLGLLGEALIRRRRPVALRLAVYAGWLALAGLALPVALLALTDDGAIRSC